MTNKLTAPENPRELFAAPKPQLYLTIFALWFASIFWFGPRMIRLLGISYDFFSFLSLSYFLSFMALAWLYGFYNICIIFYAIIYHKQYEIECKKSLPPLSLVEPPAVALLYTTYNDFVEISAESCVKQDYPNFSVYILDDSTNPDCRKQVDLFAQKYPKQVRVIRRSHRMGFKAGALNNALSVFATWEPFFAIADSDEIIPPDFLSRIVPRFQTHPNCGFIQANHVSNRKASGALAKALGAGIDSHWRWFQPYRNRYGFVMFLGHGAVIRRESWEEVGGFPLMVSEDLAFAIKIREAGWRGFFAEDIICDEDFPETVRMFRIRHMKWTRGTCEFLSQMMGSILSSKKLFWFEKCDILFPTLNLPLSLFYFFFMIDANLMLPVLFGSLRDITVVFGNIEIVAPVHALHPSFNILFTPDFFAVTLLTFFSPILCFVIDLIKKPIQLFQFLCKSTTIYAALSPLSSLGVFSYLVTHKAVFLVTGERQSQTQNEIAVKETGEAGFFEKIRNEIRNFFISTHPDTIGVQAFELGCGLIFSVACIALLQISFFGVCIAICLHPLLHRYTINNPVLKFLMYFPFILICLGVAMATASLLGMQTVFLGYGFHF